MDDENINTDKESYIKNKDIINYNINNLINKYKLES
jgi:hypothetical protein